ncbi:MAG TPA: CBS domain-containing protein [Conexivisphaerales archaeon]|nr:CBS domain-containing protein [Conexivisphaerales archaeon]
MEPEALSKLLSRPASEFAHEKPLFLDAEVSVQLAAAKMKETRHDSVLVTKNGLPVGIITERDLCYRVVAEGKDPLAVTLGQVMSMPLITLPKESTLSEALNLMVARDTRRLVLINPDGTVFGVVTRWGFTGQGSQGALVLPVNHVGKGMVCPFCASLLDSPESLSRHIDQVHIGVELTDERVPFWTKKE